MVANESITGLLAKLTSSLESTASSIPDTSTLLPSQDGISLLDVKTDLFLTYLQNLVFLILLKLKNPSSETSPVNEVIQKLVELRVYLEKGVRPLEARLKYQIDKVIRAAETATRSAVVNASSSKPAKMCKTTKGDASDDEELNGEANSDSDDSASEIDDLAYRPNPSAFTTAGASTGSTSTSAPAATGGIYRPPRITPTSLPTTSAPESRSRPSKQAHNTAISDFISTELSTAPSLEPSIGSTIVASGRHTKSTRERAVEAERTAYEESNFVRLPAVSKKEAGRLRAGRGDAFGGEELGGGFLEGVERMGGKRKVGRLENGGKDGPREDGFSGGAYGGGAGKRRKTGGGSSRGGRGGRGGGRGGRR